MEVVLDFLVGNS